MLETKFKIGDHVRRIRGDWSMYQDTSTDKMVVHFVNEDTIGSEGIISEAIQTQGIDEYALDPRKKLGNNLKHAWYSNTELELVYRPPYND